MADSVGKAGRMLARVFTEPQQGATYDQILAMAQAAEDNGFDAFFRSDHYTAFGGGDGQPGSTDAWTTLAGLARDTKRVRLGTLVTPITFRLPGPLAISVAQIDAMSGGRVELGLGTGWNPQEHTAYAIPFPPIGTRFEMLEEQLAIITGLWETPLGERFNHKGQHYELTDSPALPKPVQRPRPPVIIGGAGQKRTPRLAAAFADEFNVPFHPVEPGRAAIERVREACAKAGRADGDMIYSAALTTCCGRNDAEVARRAERIGRPKERIDLAGTPAEVLDKVGQWHEAGVQRIYFQLLDLDDLDHVGLLGAEVVPALSRLA
jgi:F420-dependent oxidoreductase-like protein